MKIEINKKDDQSYALISVSVTKEDYFPEFQKELKHYGKNISLKGFRPGKVPTSVIRSLYGKSIVMDVFNKKFSEELGKALEEEKIVTLVQPQVKGSHITPEQLMRFNDEHSVEMEVFYVAPIDFKVEELKLESYMPKPTSEDVEEQLEKLLERAKEQEPVDKVEQGDFISGVFRQNSSNFEEKTVLPTNQIAEAAQELFIGKKVGETITFDLRTAFPEDDTLKKLFYKDEETTTALQGEFTLEIEDIQRQVKPELNQEFFDQVLGEGKASNEEEFKAEYEKALIEDFEKSIRVILENKTQDKVMQDVEVGFDEDFMERLVKSFSEKPLEGEALEKNINQFRDFLKWKAITSYYFNTAELKLEESDIREARRKEVSNLLGGMSVAQFGDDFIDNLANSMIQEQDSDFSRNVLDGAILQKVMTYFVDNATIEKEEKTLKELEEIFEEFSSEQRAKAAAEQAAMQTVEAAEEEGQEADSEEEEVEQEKTVAEVVQQTVSEETESQEDSDTKEQ